MGPFWYSGIISTVPPNWSPYPLIMSEKLAVALLSLRASCCGILLLDAGLYESGVACNVSASILGIGLLI